MAFDSSQNFTVVFTEYYFNKEKSCTQDAYEKLTRELKCSHNGTLSNFKFMTNHFTMFAGRHFSGTS